MKGKRRLKVLDVAGCGVGVAGAKALAGGPLLHVLAACGCWLLAAGALVMAGCPQCPPSQLST